MSERLSILNVGGHTKDVVLYAGGTMAKHAARGDRVTALTPTYGVSLHQKATEEALDTGTPVDVDRAKRERLAELQAACAELGVSDVRCFDYDDSIPIPDREIIVQISEIIREVRPGIVVTHHPNDSVVAHGMTTQMVLAAMVHSGQTISPDLPPHYPMQVFFHTQVGDTDVLEQRVPRIPDTIIDITDVVKMKARAMDHFKSQGYGTDPRLQRKTGEMLNSSVYGFHSHVPYSETFLAYKPAVYEYLPLSEYGRKLTNLPRDEQRDYKMQTLLSDMEPQ